MGTAVVGAARSSRRRPASSATPRRKAGRATEPASRDGVAVIIASLGRPDNLRELIRRLSRQTVPPTQVILSLEQASDCPSLEGLDLTPEVVYGSRGLCHQRNRGLDLLRPESRYVLFFDDDFVPSNTALAGVIATFERFPDVAGVTGVLLADGIHGPGIALRDAMAQVDAADAGGGPVQAPNIVRDLEGLYGCNMAYRTSLIRGMRFDENLPLYAWQEDVDFAVRVPGRKVISDALRGIHCGEKRGREKNGQRLGYSQIANPVYLMRKRTISKKLALNHMTRNLLMNHFRQFHPEPWIDRRGRAAGNRRALVDLLLRRLAPQRILQF